MAGCLRKESIGDMNILEGADRIEVIPGARRTLEALRKLGYDFNSAVGDVVDNSIAKHARTIRVDFGRKGKHFSLSIIDDGTGMKREKLQEALRHGAHVDYESNSLGKFGMGLKTASLSQCRRLRVITNASGKPGGLCCGVWDLSHVEKTDRWEILMLQRKMLKRDAQAQGLRTSRGTRVLWEEVDILDRELASFERPGSADNWVGELIGRLKLYLRMTYGRYINGDTSKGKKVRFVFNGQSLTSWDPFCAKEKETRRLKAVAFTPDNKAHPGAKVHVVSYVLPEKEGFSSRQAWASAKGLLDWNDSQGLYVYRNDRLIHFGGWLRIRSKSEHTKYARVEVDVDDALDEMFDLTVDKQSIKLPQSVSTFILENTTEATRIAKVRSEKRRPVDSGVNRVGNKTGDEVFPQAMERDGIKTAAYEKGKVKVINQKGQDIYKVIDGHLAENPWVEPGEVSDGRLWELNPLPGNKFKVTINTKHPFYSKVYESGNPGLLKYLDCIITSIAYTELRIRTRESAVIFMEVRDSVSEMLRRMANADGFQRMSRRPKGER